MTRLTADDFSRLYRTNYSRAMGFFLRMTGYDHPLAEDLTQELFARLWKNRHRYDPAQPFAVWMFAAACNLCKNEYRHRAVVEAYRREQQATFSEADDGDSGTLEQEQQHHLLAEAIRLLPDGQREVFLLRYIEELPIRDVAHILHLPEGTVKSRAFLALKKLKETLQPIQ